eukprot:1542453-Rhodomonas_salina.1
MCIRDRRRRRRRRRMMMRRMLIIVIPKQCKKPTGTCRTTATDSTCRIFREDSLQRQRRKLRQHPTSNSGRAQHAVPEGVILVFELVASHRALVPASLYLKNEREFGAFTAKSDAKRAISRTHDTEKAVLRL